MKTKFFLCMRPPVIETDDRDYIKLPPPVGSSYTAVSSKISDRCKRGLQHRKRVAPERYIRQLSVKSNGNMSEGKSAENSVHKDFQKSQRIARSVSVAHSLINSSDNESVSLKNVKIPSRISNIDEVSDGDHESNSGAYLMVSSLFFTILLGKCFGIMCTLILLCYLFPHRKNDGDDGRKLKTMVVESPENGLQKEYNKRLIMDGLLERKNHYR